MSTLSNIIDALRRIGSPTEKSALRRQDEQIESQVVLQRGRHVASLGDEKSYSFHAVLEPIPEEVSELSADELSAIHRNASLALTMFEDFGVAIEDDPLEQLDKTFERWMDASNRNDYSESHVVEVLGAKFGAHCNATLGMRWVRVVDQYGASLAVEGIDTQFRAFPYHSIQKRIADKEHTFFAGIYILLADQKEHSKHRVAIAPADQNSVGN